MKKKLLRSAVYGLFFLVMSLLEIVIVFHDKDVAYRIKHIIWAILLLICASGYLVNWQDIKKGKRDICDDDERDHYIDRAAGARVAKWLNWLMFGVIVISTCLYGIYRQDDLIIIVGLSIFYWNISLILKIIFTIIEERKN
ncbi:hypothetical protein OZX69_08955 [Lactobacillus sp. ESL0731]|uniref:hypothetical protein n=1 Tax=unclassified Lactobacillus TaxID=2620435 RepID=UPI0023FA23BA|nr:MULTISPECIES: hypothetical protein [unclassified Lactobacillus]WEV51064.1 hypothetical protein OZX63_08955 [Lactobacillus sp. ESL0700]WEV62194.1 hypothetical protein OZX69_08955 [Lactobacillus sp. ESL0731]